MEIDIIFRVSGVVGVVCFVFGMLFNEFLNNRKKKKEEVIEKDGTEEHR